MKRCGVCYSAYSDVSEAERSDALVIALDAMGGDNAPEVVVQGAALALQELDIKILLVGQEAAIQAQLKNALIAPGKLEILHAPDVIGFDEVPTVAVRRKKQSSLVLGLKAVKEGQADAFVSAGSTGALLTGATVIIGRAEGIERPALGVMLPHRSGFTFLIDCGANLDAKASYLAQFGQMGSNYMQRVLGLPSPKVGLINVGAEKEKGTAVTQEAYALLAESGLNFVGNVEARDIPAGVVDVAVCDAFVGNVVLKYTEGLSKALMTMVKEELMADPISKLGALLAKNRAFMRLKKRFDYDDIGGAPFLGLNAMVVKAHGNANVRAICGAIRQCVQFKKGE